MSAIELEKSRTEQQKSRTHRSHKSTGTLSQVVNKFLGKQIGVPDYKSHRNILSCLHEWLYLCHKYLNMITGVNGIVFFYFFIFFIMNVLRGSHIFWSLFYQCEQ